MKILLKILMWIIIIPVALIIIVLIVALFVNKDYAVQRDIVINKPKQEVYDYVKLIKNQEEYSTWVRMDPNMKKELKGTDGTVGFIYAWNGNSRAGEGEQEIKKLTDGERVDIEVRFKRPMESGLNAVLSTATVSDAQTKVTWAVSGRNKYPFNFMNLFMNNMLGKDLDSSLILLKSNLEK